MSLVDLEIREQPAALARALATRREAAQRAAERIVRFAPQFVTIAARGSSDNAARYAQHLLGAHNRLAVALAVPSLHTLYGAPPRLERALVVGVSVSGQSPDVVAVVEDGRKQGAATLAITGDPGSPLARAAEMTLTLASGEERAIAATKSYTNQLMLIAMLSAALEGDPARWTALAAVPDTVAEALRFPVDENIVAPFAPAGRFVVIGRGFNCATAHEIALKMQETSYVLAEPFSSAELLHGPVAILEPGFPVVLVVPSGRAAEDLAPLCDRLEQEGVRLVAISDLDPILRRAHAPFPLPQGVPEWLSPIVAVVPGQVFAAALATARGHDPDHPRGLSKVTRTR